jgi:hypothetical protein
VTFPLGIGAAVYLAEYAPDNRLTRLLQTNISNLAGVPSIIYGIFGLAIFVRLLGFGPVLFSGAATLALVAVLLLAGWHAVGRFGPVRPRTRATGFGKAVLVDNSAKLIRRAGRERQLGSRYVQVIRERAVAIFKIPARLKDAALDAHLDKMGSGRGQRFSELARAASGAADRMALIEAAQALYKWQKERQR